MKELYDQLPIELREVFDSLDYEEEGYLNIRSVKYLNNELNLEFSISLGASIDLENTQNWELQILNYRNSIINIDDCGRYFIFYSDHVLLWEFTNNIELYFKTPTNQPEQLLSDIYKIHNSTFNSFIALEKFINGSCLSTRCNADSGLFGRGPKQILNYYFECLEKAEMNPYFLNGNFQKKINEEGNDLKLALLGRSYFIGQDFIFTKQNRR